MAKEVQIFMLNKEEVRFVEGEGNVIRITPYTEQGGTNEHLLVEFQDGSYKTYYRIPYIISKS